MKPKASNLEQLWEQVQAAWDDIDIAVNQVVVTMEEQRQAVLRAKGRQTRFQVTSIHQTSPLCRHHVSRFGKNQRFEARVCIEGTDPQK